MDSFDDLGVAPELVDALTAEGIEVPTELQAAAIPVLIRGNSVLAQAGPGAGTLVAYGIPLLQRVDPEARGPRAVVLVSTNHAASQLAASLGDLVTHVNDAKIFAGSLHTVAKRVTQRFDALMRWVETVETLNIGNLIQNVRGALASHSHHAVITARKDVKIDGERIHMG